MKELAPHRTAPLQPFVLGRKHFAAITAIEGLKLSSDSEERLRRTVTLPADQRRAETIRAFAGSQSR
jgi:hypothetical protein